ncbi:hypothetical protein LCGC14_2744370 [marine sediment metagenome]|uniref:Uncharacterized protein n=1 Tax=marine sediment metagenome TaxID=412755 RepID=A0A0F9BCE9_9ZZZZ
MDTKNTILAKSFVDTLVANLDNIKLSDEEFRQFCRNTVPIIEGTDYVQPTETMMSEKEKAIQVALGTLDIPELVPIDLNKPHGDFDHPDLKEGEDYLVHYWGEYQLGNIDSDTREFCVGAYLRRVNECDSIWFIKGRNK